MATSALAGSCSSRLAPSSASWLGPYLHHTYWLLVNPKGFYLASIEAEQPKWVTSANEVPEQHRFRSYQEGKPVWAHLRAMVDLWADGVALKPLDFYAHRSTPHLWCALDD